MLNVLVLHKTSRLEKVNKDCVIKDVGKTVIA
jgi:hypothetical protein